MNTASNSTAIVSFSVNPADGGPYKSMRLFGQALNAPIYSFSTAIEKERADADKAPVHHWEIPSHRWYPLSVWRKASQDLGGTKLISSHKIFRWSSLFVHSFSQKNGVPYWVVPHGSMDPWVFTYGKLPKAIWWNAIGRRYLRDAAAVICATEREKEKLGERHPTDNCEVIHWPTPTISIANRQQKRESLRARLGIGPNERILVYLGRFHSMKRPLETIRRVAQANLTQTHLLLVGMDGDITGQQIEQAVSATGARNIHYYGPAFGEEKAEILLGSDGLISLSNRENFNHSAAEAISAGIPLILSPGNDLGGSLRDINYGWWMNSQSDEEEIATLQAFDNAPGEQLCEMGACAKRWADENLTFEKFQTKLLALRDKTLGV